MNLKALVNVLTADTLAAAFEPASEEFDADHVNVVMDIEGFDEPITLQITEVEVESEGKSDFEMIQIYVPIPMDLDEEAADDIIGILPDVNQEVPLIGFNVHPEEKFLYFRHVMLTPKSKTGAQMVTEAVWLSQYAVDTFAQQFLEFAESESD